MEVEMEQIKNDHLHQKTTKYGDAKFRVAEFKAIDEDGVEFIFRMRAREQVFEKKYGALPLNTGLLININVNIPLTFVAKPPEQKLKEKRQMSERERLLEIAQDPAQKSLVDVMGDIDNKIKENK